MNVYKDHVYILAEEDADRQIAVGFENHPAVNYLRLKVQKADRGWENVLQTFECEFIPHLLNYPLGHVILVIDYDNDYAARRAHFDAATPAALKDRVFVLGVESTPEIFCNAVSMKLAQIRKCPR